MDRAVEALATGRLVLHPTETVVSLSGDPRNPMAVERAHRIKGYPKPRPFLCLVADSESARKLARRWSATAERLAERFWPGPLTLVVPIADDRDWPVAKGRALALRGVADPVSRELVGAWGGAIFSTSANRRGQAPAARIEDAVRRLADAPGAEDIALALRPIESGASPAAGRPSTIVDVTGEIPRLVRAGAVGLERLREVVPEIG